MSGRYQPATYWGRDHVVQDHSTNPPNQVAGPFPTFADAQAEADRLNTPPAPPPHQTALFDPQETTA